MKRLFSSYVHQLFLIVFFITVSLCYLESYYTYRDLKNQRLFLINSLNALKYNDSLQREKIEFVKSEIQFLLTKNNLLSEKKLFKPTSNKHKRDALPPKQTSIISQVIYETIKVNGIRLEIQRQGKKVNLIRAAGYGFLQHKYELVMKEFWTFDSAFLYSDSCRFKTHLLTFKTRIDGDDGKIYVCFKLQDRKYSLPQVVDVYEDLKLKNIVPERILDDQTIAE